MTQDSRLHPGVWSAGLRKKGPSQLVLSQL